MDIEFEDILEVNNDLIELVRNWRNSKSISQYMYTNHYITKDEHQNWIEKLKTKDKAKAWIIKYKGKTIGLVSLSDIDYKNKTTDWGFYIADKSAMGKGLGSAALYKLMEYVFDEMNFNKMNTKVLENNFVALRMYEKFGFKKESRLKCQLLRNGKKIDVILVGISQEEWNALKEKIKDDVKKKF